MSKTFFVSYETHGTKNEETGIYEGLFKQLTVSAEDKLEAINTLINYCACESITIVKILSVKEYKGGRYL